MDPIPRASSDASRDPARRRPSRECHGRPTDEAESRAKMAEDRESSGHRSSTECRQPRTAAGGSVVARAVGTVEILKRLLVTGISRSGKSALAEPDVMLERVAR